MERAILEAISGYEDRFNGTRHYPDRSTADVHLDVTRAMVADAIFRADLPRPAVPGAARRHAPRLPVADPERVRGRGG
jgi:hypothetical protein